MRVPGCVFVRVYALRLVSTGQDFGLYKYIIHRDCMSQKSGIQGVRGESRTTGRHAKKTSEKPYIHISI